MMIDELQIIHICHSLVSTVVIYKLMNALLTGGAKRKGLELLCYAAHYVLSLMCYYLLHTPMAMMVYSILAFFVITLNYRAGFRQRIMAVIFVYCLMFIIETLVVVLSGHSYTPIDASIRYASAFGEIANQLISLAIVYGITQRERQRGLVPLPLVYWLCIITVPIFTLYFFALVFHMGNLKSSHMVISIVFLVIINFSVLALYDRIVKSMDDRTRQLLLEQQNKYYEGQLRLMKASDKRTEAMRHDWDRHLISIRSFLTENQVEEAEEYIDKMIHIEPGGHDGWARTGNVIIDSILNIKLQEASSKGILVETKLQIPEDLKLDPFDITIILGNIVDNAIEAASKLAENRAIRIRMVYNRGRLLLEAENTYDGKVITNNGKLRTRKADSCSHGIGLQNVENAVEKYNGTVEYSYDQEWFKISVMVYV